MPIMKSLFHHKGTENYCIKLIQVLGHPQQTIALDFERIEEQAYLAYETMSETISSWNRYCLIAFSMGNVVADRTLEMLEGAGKLNGVRCLYRLGNLRDSPA